MENCTIYSHQLNFEKVVQIVKSSLPKAQVEFNDGGMQKSLVATIKGSFFGKTKTLTINYRQRQNPSYKLDGIACALTQNLTGMVNFIQSLPAENETVRDKFLYKVKSANCEMPFMAEPEITNAFAAILREILTELDGFVFAQPNHLFSKSNGQHFLDKNLNLILDTNGNCGIQDIEVHVDAKYHDQPAEAYTEEQLVRKTHTESLLQSHGIKVNKNLPCLVSSMNVKLRNTKEIIDRAYALLVIAAKGEGVEQEHLVRAIEDKKIDSFSPKETMIYQAEVLTDQDRAYATWRYESLYVMLWALGKMEDLKYPSEICDVPAIVGQLFKPARATFEDSVNLRSEAEILDQLDQSFRMNWACIDARTKDQEIAGNINPSIIYERHYALNWLTNYQEQDWDDVQTNT